MGCRILHKKFKFRHDFYFTISQLIYIDRQPLESCFKERIRIFYYFLLFRLVQFDFETVLTKLYLQFIVFPKKILLNFPTSTVRQLQLIFFKKHTQHLYINRNCCAVTVYFEKIIHNIIDEVVTVAEE